MEQKHNDLPPIEDPKIKRDYPNLEKFPTIQVPTDKERKKVFKEFIERAKKWRIRNRTRKNSEDSDQL